MIGKPCKICKNYTSLIHKEVMTAFARLLGCPSHNLSTNNTHYRCVSIMSGSLQRFLPSLERCNDGIEITMEFLPTSNTYPSVQLG